MSVHPYCTRHDQPLEWCPHAWPEGLEQRADPVETGDNWPYLNYVPGRRYWLYGGTPISDYEARERIRLHVLGAQRVLKPERGK